MFSEKGPRNSGEQNGSQEQLNLEKQKNKLIGFYLSGGDERYIFNTNEDSFSERRVTPSDKEVVHKKMRNGEDFTDIEWKLLTRIKGPDQIEGMDRVFWNMFGDERQKRILGNATGMNWDDFNNTSRESVVQFLRAYPTPMEYDGPSKNLLQMILNYSGEQELHEYESAMEKFQLNVYGKKYEYYKAMKEVHQEATKEAVTEREAREEFNKFGRKLFEIFNRDRLVADSGLATINRGTFTGEPNKPNEDAAYYNPAIGLFGVFDGAGGMRGGARASQLGAGVVEYSANQDEPETPNELAGFLQAASDTIQYDNEAGYSTAVLGRIVETRGRKALIWASVGDSRIYVVRNKKAMLLTEDEGYGNRISNALGLENCQVRQAGEFPLKKGDRVVFCSDGVTGDYEQDFIPDDEFGRLVGEAETADIAAQALIQRATKRDDRTAIVVQT